jgi:hypothetical protein
MRRLRFKTQRTSKIAAPNLINHLMFNNTTSYINRKVNLNFIFEKFSSCIISSIKIIKWGQLIKLLPRFRFKNFQYEKKNKI